MNTTFTPSACQISVIVAVRNAGATLRQTLQSLMQQTLQNFEIILIDGASTDNTLGVVDDFNHAIRIRVSEPDSGIADAWNKGARHASGDWLVFLNAGDLLHRDHFKRAIDTLGETATEPTILFCDVLKFNERNEPTIKISGRTPTHRGISRGGIGFAHPGSLSAASCFKAIGFFDTSLQIAIDTDWLLRCFKAGHTFKKFQSCAYMAEGGVSDRKFGKAMLEYFSCTTKLGLTTKRQAAIFSVLLPAARECLHIYRAIARSPLRTLKHGLVALANCLAQLLPFYWMRRAYFRIMGFKLERGASIAMGFGFYRSGQIHIGENSVVNRNCLFDNRDRIIIGKNVSIARDVKIFTAGHDPASPFFEMTAAPVVIGDHVVIFSGATLMPGVRIGEGAVIYGGAVVTKNVQPLAMVGGVPARTIGMRPISPDYTLNYSYPLAM